MGVQQYARMLGLSIAQYYLLYPKQLTSLTTLISTALSTAISPVCRSFKWKALDALAGIQRQEAHDRSAVLRRLTF